VRKFLESKSAATRLHEHEEDLFQEGMLALFKAEHTFNPTSGAKLETYASRVITNRFIDVWRKVGEAPDELNEETQGGALCLDNEMDLEEIRKILREQVSDLERAIFNSYYIEGFSYDEIGRIFELPRKKIDNIVQKVKRKIKEYI